MSGSWPEELKERARLFIQHHRREDDELFTWDVEVGRNGICCVRLIFRQDQESFLRWSQLMRHDFGAEPADPFFISTVMFLRESRFAEAKVEVRGKKPVGEGCCCIS